ncbi:MULTISPECIES: DASS family sodium-coupled anion symporter [unclassified Variovorax]|uniref:SLC13 family permease n=1 Tax=unclassified Variovorax TaxID=663243 RepID=UPI00076D7A49|nr:MULTISPECIES: DASS family sodium-coupled anion symporter [unclassified Variovorax]KWT82842.1 transporter, NadC family [Variovorax sp. WDL1]PNG52431.1 Sodium-dependent dicarboxylate transporter SdcS [Variovorax sp. B4]PNG54971.1 Sodium-dependent dicarboxylate transporter SdcS [Variovorax sp. B2]VTV15992.1 Na(+)/dicarboxylate symporter [Variovorax sp. WDL1]
MTWPSASLLRGLACLLLAALVYRSAPPPEALRTGLALFVLVGGLWMTQALHLSVTALLVPLLAVLTGLMDLRTALASFAHPVIFLFLGGFALAAALQQQGLDRRLAMAVLRLAAGRRAAAVAMLFGLTAVLSMWISNTATAAMMLPLALGLLGDEDGPRERAFVLLGVAYSASIGGIGTLVGSPPNAIAAAQAGIGFAEWMRIGVPLVVLLLPLMAAVLFLVLRPRLLVRVAAPGEESTVAPWTRSQRFAVAVFVLAAAGWIGGAPLGRALGITADIDSVVAVAAIVALVAGGAIGWPEIERRTHWGVLLLFGGGLTLSEVMAASGASRFMAGALIDTLHGAPLILLLVGVVAFVVFLTELVSNTASAALLVPIFLGVAAALGLPPPLFAASIAVSASCAFMLPVATPPNAIVYATDQVPQATMMRCGLVLNLVCIGAITAVAAIVFA